MDNPDKKLQVTKKTDLISLVHLTKIISEREGMELGEAFDYIDKIISSEPDEIILFDTLTRGLPLMIFDRDNALCNLLNSHWWETKKGEEQTIYIATKNTTRDETPASYIAIRKAEAIRLFRIKTEQPIISAQPAQIATALAYSTAWMNIQQAAINEFFNPRRNPDAKKEEVTEWIKSAALAAGLLDSQNIASTIFTIIKPGNHDPKKKRVEPE